MESDLLQRFRTRTEIFAHAGLALDLLLPLSADELIDDSELNTDERLPYWADIWASGRALTRHVLDAPPPRGRVIELGSGVALPSLALGWRGVGVLATDYYPEALEFARLNALRNAIAAPETLVLDWRDPPAGLGRFEEVIASDVLYERRNVSALVGLLPRLVAEGGRVRIADPGRAYAGELFLAMADLGWEVREVGTVEEPAPAGAGVLVRVRLVELLCPIGSGQRPPPKA